MAATACARSAARSTSRRRRVRRWRGSAALQPVAAIETPGRLLINASGDLKAGVEIDAQADLFDAKFGYRGRLTETDGVLATQGRGGFNADRPGALLKAIGLSWPVAGLLSVEANISSAKGSIKSGRNSGGGGQGTADGRSQHRRTKGEGRNHRRRLGGHRPSRRDPAAMDRRRAGPGRSLRGRSTAWDLPARSGSSHTRSPSSAVPRSRNRK